MIGRGVLLRIVLVLVAVFVALPIGPRQAFACSCSAGEPRAALLGSDAAFIGQVISIEDPPEWQHSDIRSSADIATWRIRVDEALKGELDEVIEVKSANSGVSCGLGLGVGERAAVFLTRENGAWTSGLCSTIDPAALRKAAKPLPSPNGSGEVAFVLGGVYGEARIITLDARGRVLRYGPGSEHVSSLASCPGARRLVELSRADEAPYQAALMVRDLDTLKIVESKVIPDTMRRPPDAGFQAGPALCSRGDEVDVSVFLTNNHGQPNGIAAKILRFTRGRINERWSGNAISGAFGPSGDTAILVSQQGRVFEVNLLTGRERTIATIDKAENVVLSPDGRWAAGVMATNPKTSFFILDIASGTHRATTVTHSPRMTWIDNEQLLVMASESNSDAVVYDKQLERVASWGPWPYDAVVVGRKVYASDHGGELLVADALTGGPRTIATIGTQPFIVIAIPPDDGERSTPIAAIAITLGAAALLVVAFGLSRRSAR